MTRLLPLMCALVVALSTPQVLAGGLCPGDVNGDGVTDVNDLNLIIIRWGTDDSAADINDDGVVDVNDLNEVIIDWNCDIGSLPTTTIFGTVRNAWTNDPIVGAVVTVGTEELITDIDGDYSGLLDVGPYDVTFEADNYFAEARAVVLFPDVPLMADEDLVPEAAVIVSIDVTGTPDPGGSVMANAVVEIFDGSVITDYEWMQLSGVPAMLSGTDTDTLTADLADQDTYKDQLITTLREPPITEDQLPPNVPPPPGEFPAGLQDRFQVVGMSPFALEESGAVALEVAVTTSSGVYVADADVHTHLPWVPKPDIRNVPLNEPVMLLAKEQASYAWSLTKPPASMSTFDDPTSQYPVLTPDFAGMYQATIMDLETMMPVTIELFAGNYRGIITGQDEFGNPIPDETCRSCHELLGFERFTPWAETGHAEIFKNNLESSPYWGPQCFGCHTVGYNPDADNGGIDEAVDYGDFLASGLIGAGVADAFQQMLDFYPQSAQLSNIQCENCHGPQWGFFGANTLAHGPSNPMGLPRTSLSSDVCATCHGEPLRHARFQQWQLSGHANYEVAIDESQSGSCSRCHTANGFLAWLPILTGDVPGDPTASIPVTWTEDEAHPQTCVACHDPHMIGDTSGIDTNATVRISGDTPPLIAGFTAYAVGRGAICITCHNSRRGLRNDSTFDDHYGTSEASRGPHGSAQGDMMMGENAYLVQTGIRGGHSFLEDTCVKCHMEETPPPADLSYNLGGTNHTFYASNTICTNCHTGIDGPTFQDGVMSTLHVLQDSVESAIYNLIEDQTSMGNLVDFNGGVLVSDIAQIDELELTEYHGRQALIVTLSDMSVLGPYTMNSIDVLDPGMLILGELYDFADPAVVKGGWNWGLVHNDGSGGAHNPTFTYAAMSAAITALDPLLALEMEWPDWVDLEAYMPPTEDTGSKTRGSNTRR